MKYALSLVLDRNRRCLPSTCASLNLMALFRSVRNFLSEYPSARRVLVMFSL